jgi:energy-coupling factor transporter ATP-binding protein EcfA2
MSAGIIYPVREVFTPTSPARLTFVDRGMINEKLVNALRTPGKQVVVYGHSGSGKTTLLVNKLDQLFEHHVSTRCMRGLTFEQLILDAFDQLSPFYISEQNGTEKDTANAGLGAEYWGIKCQLAGTSETTQQTKQQRVLPPQLTPQALARFLGQASCCWVLEDFHKIDESVKTGVSQMMKVFMDTADEYPDLKIIAIGAVDTARQVVQYDAEMRNRVAEIHVPLMSDDELRGIITKGEELLNIAFEEGIKALIVHYSNGLASVCHHLCLNTCVAAGVEVTHTEKMTFSEQQLKAGLAQYLEEASDTLKHAFDLAFQNRRRGKFDNCRLVLHSLSKCPQEGGTHAEILAGIGEKDYPSGNLTQYLKELQSEDRGSIIRFDSVSRKFAFADPIYRAFCLTYFVKNPVRRTNVREVDSMDINAVITHLKISLDSIKFLGSTDIYHTITLPMEPGATDPNEGKN